MFTLKFNSKKNETVKTSKNATKVSKKSANTAKKQTKMSKKTVQNAPKNENKMSKMSTKNPITLVIESNLQGLELLASQDKRFASVNFKAEEASIKTAIIEIMANAPMKAVANTVEVEVEKPKAAPKKAIEKATKKVEKKGHPSKKDIAYDFIFETSENKDEDERWFTNDHLVEAVVEIWGEDERATSRKTVSTLVGKLKSEGYEFEESNEIFENENGRALKAFRMIG